MNDVDAQKLVNRLSQNYNNLAVEEHMRVIQPWNYQTAYIAIEQYIDTCDYPSIPKLKEIYAQCYKTDEQKQKEQKQGIGCYVCMDDGYVVLRSGYGDPGKAYWCDKCESQPKHDLMPISRVMDTDELEQHNVLLRTGKYTQMPEHLRRDLLTFARRQE